MSGRVSKRLRKLCRELNQAGKPVLPRELKLAWAALPSSDRTETNVQHGALLLWNRRAHVAAYLAKGKQRRPL